MLAIAALAASIAVPAAAQVGLGLAPMRSEFRLQPGQQRSGTLTLAAETAAKVRIRAEVDDFLVDDEGTPQFEAVLPSEAETSCKGWLILNPMELEAEPNQKIQVRYTFRVPAGAKEGSYHCAAGFATLPAAGEPVNGIRTAVRVVSAFYIVVGNPALSGSLKSVAVEPLSTDDAAHSFRAVVVFDNSGALQYRPTGKVDLLDAENRVVESAELPSLPILPNRRQRVPMPFKTDISSGTFKLRARVDIGNNEIQQATVDIAPRPGEKR